MIDLVIPDTVIKKLSLIDKVNNKEGDPHPINQGFILSFCGYLLFTIYHCYNFKNVERF